MRNTRHIRRGGAMVLVTITMGVASVLALSLLSSSSLQARTSGNAARGADAEYLAETGVNVAFYYLQNPLMYTGAKPDGYYPGESSVNLGTGAPGTVSTDVDWNSSSGLFAVRATGVITGSEGSLQRTVQARVRPIHSGNFNFTPVTEGLITNGPLKLDTNMLVQGAPGAVRSTKSITVVSGGRILGDAISDEIIKTGSGEITGASKNRYEAEAEVEAGSAVDEKSVSIGVGALVSTVLSALFRPYVTAPPLPADGNTLVPSPAYVPDLRTYRYRNIITGITLNYNAVKLAGTAYSGTTLGATLLNPGGIYWTDQDVTLTNVTINGTLILRNGAKLTIKSGGTTEIRAATGYPAVVSDSAIVLESGANFISRGLTYANKVSAAAGTTGSFLVEGALLLHDTVAPFPTDNYAGTVGITFNTAKAQIGGFGVAIADTDIRSLKVVSWNPN